MKKVFLCLACLIFSFTSAKADEIDKLIKEFNLNKKSELSVYVKNLDTNKVLYKKHSNFVQCLLYKFLVILFIC